MELITLDIATVAQRQAAQQLVLDVLAEFGFPPQPEALDADVAALGSVYRPPSGQFWLVLSDGGRVVGTAGIRRLRGSTAELKRMYLLPETRGQGWGQRLLEQAIDFARRAGYGEIVLDTIPEMDAANRLYRRAGFRPTEDYNQNPRAGCFYRLVVAATEETER